MEEEEEEVLIVIEDSNVDTNIDNITIYEEKIKEDVVLVLNKEQIVNELTTLLVNKYKELSKVHKKVNLYMNLLGSIEDNKKDIIIIDTIKPIFFCKKIVIQHGDKDDLYGEIDEEFQDTFSLKAQTFDTFIGQFNSLNKNNSNSYLHTTNALYSLTKPFINTDIGQVDYTYDQIFQPVTVDAFRHFVFKDYDVDYLKKANVNKFETFRLIGSELVDTGRRPEIADEKPGCTSGLHYISTTNEQTIYEGDKINLVGYINIGLLDNDTDTDKLDINNIHTFDITEYFNNVSKLEINTKVRILFNDFAFDKKGNIIQEIEGTVTKNSELSVVVLLSKILTINGVKLSSIKIDINKNNCCFIYDVKYEGYLFNKVKLKRDTIIFTLFDNSQSTLDIIKPITISELFLMNIDLFPNIINVYELRRLVNDVLHIDFDKITIEMQNILTILMNSNKDLSLNVTVPLPLPLLLNNNIINPVYHIPLYSNNIDILDFNKYSEFLKDYSQQYSDEKTFIDTTLNRYNYLQSKNDYGYLYILQIIKEKINKKYKLINNDLETFTRHLSILKKEIDIISKDIIKSKTISKTKRIIAKQYNNYLDVENDNNKTIYHDKEFDHTPYILMNSINTNLTENEKKHAIIEILNMDKKYNSLSNIELEFEAKSIIKGKRKIRYGSHAILYLEDGSSVIYVRNKIENNSLWIKIFKAPFPICTTNIESFDEMQNAEAIILDPFDMLCKKQKDIRLNIDYHNRIQKISIIESIIAFIVNFNKININIDADIEYYKLQLQLIGNDTVSYLENLRRYFKITVDEENIENIYEDYIGDIELLDLDKIFNNVDFNESSPMQLYYDKKEIIVLGENEDIIETFVNLNDIILTDTIKKYMLLQINTTYPKKDILDKVVKEEQKLKKNMNKLKYETKLDYKLQFDALVKTKLSDFELIKFKEYYANVIIFTAGLLILIIMAEYPNILIKKIIPKCVKYFSYIGHTIAPDNATQTLTKYFACIIGSIGVPGDILFYQFSLMSLQDIEKKLKDIIDDIQESNPEIVEKINDKKILLLKIKQKNALNYSKYMTLNNSFKPNFVFKQDKIYVNKDDENIINYLKEINDIIKNTKILKNTIFNNPLLVNSCCIEKLTSVTNFYNFFNNTNNINYNIVKNKLNKLPFIFPITSSYIPSSLIVLEIKNLFGDKEIDIINSIEIENKKNKIYDNSFNFGLNIFIKENNIILNDELLQDLSKNSSINYTNLDWWGDIFYPKLDKDFDYLCDIIKKYYDKVNLDVLSQVKTIINGKYFSKNLNLRASIFSFMKFRLKSSLAQIINKKKIIDDTGENNFVNLLDSLQLNSEYDNILIKLKVVFLGSLNNISNLFFNTDDDTLLIQNISVLMYLFIQILISILYITVNDDYNITQIKSSTLQLLTINQKKLLTLSSSIIFYLFDDLIKFIILNDTDNDKIKKSIEELREKQKQEMIKFYSLDDEQRKLQIQLKKIGLDFKLDIPDDLNKEDKEIVNISTENIQNIQEYQNTQDDNENYNIGAYLGDNDDGDNIEEDSYANNDDY